MLDAATLPGVGQSGANGLAFAVAMRSRSEPNQHGIPGLALVAKPAGKPDRMGCGQHEQSPFLLAASRGFTAGAERFGPSGAVDIAPTILSHLCIAFSGLDGTPLQG